MDIVLPSTSSPVLPGEPHGDTPMGTSVGVQPSALLGFLLSSVPLSFRADEELEHSPVRVDTAHGRSHSDSCPWEQPGFGTGPLWGHPAFPGESGEAPAPLCVPQLHFRQKNHHELDELGLPRAVAWRSHLSPRTARELGRAAQHLPLTMFLTRSPTPSSSQGCCLEGSGNSFSWGFQGERLKTFGCNHSFC